MKKYYKIIVLLTFLFLISGCKDNKYSLNKEITLKGIVTTSEIKKDNETYKVSILNLNEPIVVDGTKINKIEIDYDKNLKNNSEVTIIGKIKNNEKDNLDLAYSFSVIDVDNILSYVNTFTNKDFSVTIPTSIIKKCTIKEIENGYAIYETSSSENEIFKIIAVSKEEFKALSSNESKTIEKVRSNNEKVVVLIFESNDENIENYETYNEIMQNISDIKTTIKLK